MKKRLEWLDAAKGYGILLVIIGQIYSNGLLGWLIPGFMPLFYLAAGFTDHYCFSVDVIVTKAKRLLIPYIVYGLFAVLFYDLFGSKSSGLCIGSMHEWLGLLYSRFCLYPLGTEPNVYFLPLKASAPLWFLTSLFLGFVLYYIVFTLSQYKKRYCLGVLLCLFLTVLMNRFHILLPWSIDIAFLIAAFIFVGKGIAEFKLLNDKKFILLLCLVNLVFYVVLCKCNGGINLSVRQFGNLGSLSVLLYFLIGISYFVFVSSAFIIAPNLITKIFAFLGRLSMRLLCIHMIFYTLFDKLFSVESIDNKFLVIIKVVLVIITAWLLEFAYKKMKLNFCIKYL